MRILQVVHGYPPQKWGGTEVVTATLTQALAERGHQMTVFARTDDTTAEEFSVRDDELDTDEPKVRVVRVVNNLSHISHFRLGYDNPFLDEAFRRILTEDRPDIVHIQHLGNLSGSLIRVPAQLGYPVVLSLHDFFFACSRHYLIDNHTRLCPGPDRGERCIACLESMTSADEARRRFAYFEQLLHIPRKVIVPSRFLADRMREIFPVLESRLHTVAPGVVPSRQVQQEDRKDQQSSPLRVLCIGMLAPYKGPHVLMRAMQGFPVGSIAVSLYGGRLAVWNAYADRLEADAADLPIRFCGTYRHEQLSAILARHDVLVIPSICEETFSLVAREALQAGLPVIAARRGALPEVIRDGVNGLLFEPENTADLRRCLERLRTDTRLREQLTPAATPIRDPAAYALDMEAVYEAVRDKPREESLRQEGSPHPSPLPEGEGRPKPTRSVSVCLPTYNGADYIEEALRSILNQTYQDFELLVVDDGSTDTTLDIVQSFSDPRIQLHRNPERLGIPANWNRCLELAAGELVCLFHQDDVMLPENLECKVQLLSADETVGFVHSGVETLAEESAPSSFADWIEDTTEDTLWDGPEYFRSLLLNGNRVCAPTVLARRSALLEQGGFDPDLGFACDYAMWLRLCLTYRVGFLAQPLVRYRWHGGNASHAYQFERGVEEISTAARRGLRLYHERGSHADGPVLDDALTALDALRHWAAELQRGKAWLEGQQASWRSVAATQNDLIRELKGWIEELETGKTWLEAQRTDYERVVQEQQAWIGELEKAGAWMEEQRNNWENIARQHEEQAAHWQENFWGRLCIRLKLVEPVREFPVKTEPDAVKDND
ncbi:MAG: glycosyltransferase [Desulfurellaceae bacterium]|nr:glycosyltransferase [Desulfurellaceae bacterium]